MRLFKKLIAFFPNCAIDVFSLSVKGKDCNLKYLFYQDSLQKVVKGIVKLKAYFELKICDMSHHKKQEHHIRPYKLAAQSAGLIVCIVLLLFIAGKGMPPSLKNDANEMIPFIPLLVIPFAGYFVTWFKEFAGALMMIAGGIILLAFLIVKGDTGLGLVYGIPFIAAGFLFLVHINKRSQLQKKHL